MITAILEKIKQIFNVKFKTNIQDNKITISTTPT